jgi:phosphatidylserine/phosphatidylglycerophosphate/cardiolipin synthase-like enzyme
MSTTDAFVAPVFTEVLLTALSRLRSRAVPAELLIGSPWLSDVPLFPGIFAGTYPYLLPDTEPNQVGNLGAFISTWISSGGTCILLTQGYHPDNRPQKLSRFFNKRELEFLASCQQRGAEILIGHGFHDKFLLVPDVVLSGSVNVTYSGLYHNRERLSLHSRSSAPNDFLSARTVCMNHVDSARQAGFCDPPNRPYGVATWGTLAEIAAAYEAQWN